jgi:hypothetical protein
VAPLADLVGARTSDGRALPARAALTINDPMGTAVAAWWTFMRYASVRRRCWRRSWSWWWSSPTCSGLPVAVGPSALGLGAPVLIFGCGYAVVAWLRSLLQRRTGFNL